MILSYSSNMHIDGEEPAQKKQKVSSQKSINKITLQKFDSHVLTKSPAFYDISSLSSLSQTASTLKKLNEETND